MDVAGTRRMVRLAFRGCGGYQADGAVNIPWMCGYQADGAVKGLVLSAEISDLLIFAPLGAF